MIIKKSSNFTPAPEGVHNAVCVDVVDLGMVESQFGTRRTIRMAWELEEKMADGRPFIASKRYTASLHEKSNLHKDLKSWRGRAFTADELAGFELDNIIGAPCQLVIQQEERDGVIYSNVVAITKATKKITPSGSYIRVQDREQQGGGSVRPAAHAETEQAGEFDDIIPF